MLQAGRRLDKKNARSAGGRRRNRRSCNYTVILLPKRMRDDGRRVHVEAVPGPPAFTLNLDEDTSTRDNGRTERVFIVGPGSRLKGESSVASQLTRNSLHVVLSTGANACPPVRSGPVPPSFSCHDSFHGALTKIPGRLVRAIRAAWKSCHRRFFPRSSRRYSR